MRGYNILDKYRLIILFGVCSLSQFAYGQTYNMLTNNGQTINTCNGSFYDTGGSANYSNNEDYTVTFCADNGGQLVLNFTSFVLESSGTCSYDYLRIYQGINTGGVLIGEFCGTNNPGSVISSSGCLHVVFHSDVSVTASGWEAVIACTGGGGGGPEICDDGIDNDGNGFIDLFDDACSCENTDFFYGNCAYTCEYIPPPTNTNFDITQEWISTEGVTNISQLFAGDMDGEADGVSEIIAMKAMNYGTSDINAIYILDGMDGSLKYNPTTLRISSRNKGIAIGDTDKDGRTEFFYITSDDETTGNSRKIVCYEYDPSGVNPGGSGTGTFSLQWISNRQVTCGLSGVELFAVEDFPIGLADFNNDGTPEVYIGNEIYNALTGQFVTSGGTNSMGSWNQGEFDSHYHVIAVPIAIDVLPDLACGDCSGLELVAGNQVYSVNISAGTMTIRRQAPSNLPDGNTAIADYDHDGDLDAVISTNNSSSSFIYIWDLQTNTQIGGTHTVANVSSLFYHPISLATIADFDGDGRAEIGVCGNNVLQIIEDHTVNITGTGGLLWTLTTTDRSGQTGISVFDFNGDGTSEVVYRDENRLRILSGINGSDIGEFNCASGTGAEYSLVVDIDNDGETEIVCNCSDVPGSSNAVAYPTAFKSDNFPWVSTRKLWNQYAYFNVNINDDLTIPIEQQLHHLIGNPALGNTGVLNTFLQQSPLLDEDGTILFPASDLTVETKVDASRCLSDNIVGLDVMITNSGVSKVPEGATIAIYASDPETTNASILDIITISNSIDTNSSVVVNHILDVSSLTFPTSIYLIVNDDGSQARPYSFTSDFPVTAIGECDFENNKEVIFLRENCINEICDNGIDDDGDNFVDELCSDCNDCSSINIYNGDIEIHGLTSLYSILPNLDGWNKSPSDGFELWGTGFTPSGWTSPFQAYTGNYSMELNANVASTAYQIIEACPGNGYSVVFAHMARSSLTERVYFVVYDNDSNATPNMGNEIFRGTSMLQTSIQTWQVNRFDFILPLSYSGGPLRIEFQSYGGASPSYGNIIDAINVTLTCNLREICNNGIDDDFDGLVDGEDDECCAAQAPTLSKQ